ncbi:MAG: hypothetical protein JJU20_13880, partial [Opitutales bacterium]|nr:hypothetical protein [Opitutales bacterium]
MSKLCLLVLFLSLLLSNLTSIYAQSQAVGSLPGDVVVTNAGSANYSIPIQLPSGTGGMEPSLSLNYSSMGGNGPLGVGWSLDGLSSITRTGHSYFPDEITRGIEFNGDLYALDGQRLVDVGESGGVTEYRTHIESFSRITSHGTAGADGPRSWVVRTKAGLRMSYGSAGLGGNSRIWRDGYNSEIVTWLVDKIEDTAGNYMTVEYHPQDYAGIRSQVVKKISYTGNQSANLSPYYSVQFLYELRPDTSEAFMAGVPFSQTRRLKHILVVEGAQDVTNPSHSSVIRHYQLNYTQSPANGLSMLTSIQVTGSNGSETLSLAPTQFEYSGDTPVGEYEVAAMSGNAGNWYGDSTANVEPSFHLMDIAGTGDPELVKVYVGWEDSIQRRQVFLTRYQNGPSGAPTVAGQTIQLTGAMDSFPARLNAEISAPSVHVADFTGNGRSDLLLFHRYLDLSTGQWYRLYRLFVSDGTTLRLVEEEVLEGRFPVLGSSNFGREQVIIGDLSGNGLPDIFRFESFEVLTGGALVRAWRWSVDEDSIAYSNPSDLVSNFALNREADGSPVETEVFLSMIDGTNTNIALDELHLFLTDFNGDGLTDLGISYRDGDYANVKLFPGTYRLLSIYGHPRFDNAVGTVHLEDFAGWTPGNEIMAHDVNGNGLMDIVMRWNHGGNSRFEMYRSDGFEFTHWKSLTLTANGGDISLPSGAGTWDDHATWFFNDLNGNGDPSLVYFHHQIVSHASSNYLPVFNVIDVPAAYQTSVALEINSHSWAPAVSGSHTVRKALVPRIDTASGDPGFLLLFPGSTSGTPSVASAIAGETGYHPPNLLTQVTNGMGATTKIEYGHLQEPGLYDLNPPAGPEAAVYPIVEIIPPMWVVSSVSQDVGSTNANHRYETLYTYGAARAHLKGHGFLGFGSFMSYDTKAELMQYQILEQSWPLTGMAISTRNYYVQDWQASDVVLINQSDNTHMYSEVRLAGTSDPGGSYFPMTLRAVDRSWEFRESK